MPEVISHRSGSDADLATAVSAARSRIESADPSLGSREALLGDLDLLTRIPYGRWLLIHGGWNAAWTRYAIDYRPPTDPHTANPVELLLLAQSPGILATRERAAIFTEVLTPRVTAGTVALSAGCGFMDELLRLPDAHRAEALIGVDLDPEAIAGANLTAAEMSPRPKSIFAVGDAWNIDGAEVVHGNPSQYRRLVSGGVDVLSSNGLNVYVEDDEVTTDLYRSFASVMRPGGTLVVSALTPPETWNYTGISRETTRRLHGLMLMCDVMWSHYRTEATTRAQLDAAGFDVADVRWDSYRAYPTFVATARSGHGH